MTQRYMHLSPAALDAAIRLLEQPAGPVNPGHHVGGLGDIVRRLRTSKEGQWLERVKWR